jgi:hypothetical protein
MDEEKFEKMKILGFAGLIGSILTGAMIFFLSRIPNDIENKQVLISEPKVSLTKSDEVKENKLTIQRTSAVVNPKVKKEI